VVDGAKEPERLGEIIDAAARIFGERGYKRASVRAIASELGLLQGSLYHYVTSKEDLLYAVIKRFHDRSWSVLEDGRAVSSSPLAQITAVIKGHVRLCAERQVDASVFYGEFRALQPERRAEIMEWRHRYEVELRTVVDQAKEEGEIPANTDSHIATLNVLSMINSVFTWYRAEGEASIDEIAETFAKLAVRGLRAKPSQASVHDTSQRKSDESGAARQVNQREHEIAYFG